MAICPDHISNGAIHAVIREADGVATLEDLAAYRAWVTWWRMHGDSEAALRSALITIDAMAARLEVAA